MRKTRCNFNIASVIDRPKLDSKFDEASDQPVTVLPSILILVFVLGIPFPLPTVMEFQGNTQQHLLRISPLLTPPQPFLCSKNIGLVTKKILNWRRRTRRGFLSSVGGLRMRHDKGDFSPFIDSDTYFTLWYVLIQGLMLFRP